MRRCACMPACLVFKKNLDNLQAVPRALASSQLAVRDSK